MNNDTDQDKWLTINTNDLLMTWIYRTVVMSNNIDVTKYQITFFISKTYHLECCVKSSCNFRSLPVWTFLAIFFKTLLAIIAVTVRISKDNRFEDYKNYGHNLNKIVYCNHMKVFVGKAN